MPSCPTCTSPHPAAAAASGSTGPFRPTPPAAVAVHGSTTPFRPAPPRTRIQVLAPEDLARLVRPVLDGWDREHCVMVALDTKHRVLQLRTVSLGTVDHTFMGPREIFREALMTGASAVALAHNHPSGDPEPSADDRAVTRRLAEVGALLAIPLLDHLVIGRPDWVSLARRGVL